MRVMLIVIVMFVLVIIVNAMAVAHLMGLSLVATRKRHRLWESSGGKNWIVVDLATIPHRKFYRRDDDD
jgi:hypothetical protein